MPRFMFEKLVRDKIIEHQLSTGAKPKYRLLSNKQHVEELIKKIAEEAQEVLNAETDKLASEIADVQQAIDDLIIKYGLTKKNISDQQKSKNDKNGSFKKGIYIEYVDVDEKSEWTKYYRENADRYPEIK